MSDPSPGCRELVSYRYLREKYSQNVVTRVRRLINIRVRIAKYRSHLYFNHRCTENKVLPLSLRLKPPVRSVKGYKLLLLLILYLMVLICPFISQATLVVTTFRQRCDNVVC